MQFVNAIKHIGNNVSFKHNHPNISPQIISRAVLWSNQSFIEMIQTPKNPPQGMAQWLHYLILEGSCSPLHSDSVWHMTPVKNNLRRRWRLVPEMYRQIKPEHEKLKLSAPGLNSLRPEVIVGPAMFRVACDVTLIWLQLLRLA